jgi:uncharacterized protein
MRVALLCLLLCAPLCAQQITLDPPGEFDFILDKAGLITPEHETTIKETCRKLLADKATPIIVVTIESMAKYGGGDLTIEAFATLLFNQWQIGHAELHGKEWNTGMLLLVSKLDRKARIEFGAGLGHRYNRDAQEIMDNLIIPNFKAGNFSQGILSGVEGLDAIARGLEVPRAPTPVWVYFAIAGFIGLMIFTVVSLIRRGSSGWAWLFWGVVFTVLGFMLMSMLTRRSGGGFGGGSFGGGFSGGGGASGSW